MCIISLMAYSIILISLHVLGAPNKQSMEPMAFGELQAYHGDDWLQYQGTWKWFKSINLIKEATIKLAELRN